MEEAVKEHHENGLETPESLYISLNQAAKLWGKSKGNLSNLAKAGKFQWHDQPNGERKLFLPELATYFGKPPGEHQKPVSKLAVVSSRERQENTGNTSTLQAELTAAREMIDVLRGQMKREADLLENQLRREQENADRWRRQAEEAQQMLKALPAPAGSSTPTPEKRGLWSRLTGRTA
jgi:hypothetical protein